MVQIHRIISAWIIYLLPSSKSSISVAFHTEHIRYTMSSWNQLYCMKVRAGHCIFQDIPAYYDICNNINGTVVTKASSDCALFDCQLGNFSALIDVQTPNGTVSTCLSGNPNSASAVKLDRLWTLFGIWSLVIVGAASVSAAL